ncbi:hypothetical protein AMS68_001351 [Peltaster fructicola]|uniref:Transcription initiation factor TFIID subunit 2 n=1 Tax=Peltaster fructicola TaxID=286661 RepID=A0A6H0XM82_9PEZI|nr:hypothetical protein AMS68_001351 [Peltaster fructicola]
MPGFLDDGAYTGAPGQIAPDFTILKQSVDLDINFVRRALRGSTEITLQPQTRDLKHVRLHCRQCRPISVQIQGINARWECDDPYRRLRMPGSSTIYQHEMLKSKIESSVGPAPEPELDITLPPKLKFQELQIDPVSALPQYSNVPSLQKQESDAMALVETPTALGAGQGVQFAPIMIYIEFEVESFREGLHWIGFDDDDNRYPHVYTMAKLSPGTSSCIFPCLDDATTRCSWDFSIKCSKTIGDAFLRPRTEVEAQAPTDQAPSTNDVAAAARAAASRAVKKRDQYYIDLTEEDGSRELTVLCVGELVEDITDSEDESRHTVSFSLTAPVTARHVGFAIGPFEHVDLGAFREADDEEKLGQNAIKISGYCLPTRSDELRNTAMPVHLAIDYFGVNYGSFPFSHHQMLFLDDMTLDTVPIAGISLCSSRLLFGEDILEPITRNTKILMRAIADQWMGVNVIAKEATDAWVVAGIAGFMTDLFGKRLFGNNEYRWSQKIAAEQVYDLDADRPSIHQLGALLHIDSSIRDFINLKSALVLFILDRRLMKASSSTGVTRIINKIFLNAKTGSLANGELSTMDFQKTCERLGHNKLDPFFKQWVFGAGCPIFEIKQRFNKKKLVVEMTITQRQMDRLTKPEFAPDNFMREIKEHVQEVWAPEIQPVFTGPMTIRIHEADGTPYEHIVEIKEQITKLEIPYNTKYKRLKRSRRQRERAIAASGNNDANGEGGDDALLYCLGDILDTAQDVEDWNLKDWSQEDEEKMGQESYEWIRMDADFEWIGRIHLWLPVYMYVSQLQQDRDLAAQYDSIKYIESCGPHHVSLSVLVRTLMDQRYFHGIRTMAANAIATIARDKFQEIGQYHLEKAFSTMFCFDGSIMPRPNDWSSRVNFIVQCAIPTAMARLRDAEGKVPMAIRRLFVDKLKFNDNSNNEFSDAHYVATLMTCLADSLAVSHREQKQSYHFDFDGGDDLPMDVDNPDADFEQGAVSEIERYRRIDEWVSTYQNIYSITALECLQKLKKAGIVGDKTRELLIYTRRTNAPDVRLAAYNCLNGTGITKRPLMLKYMLHELADDASPYVRNRLLKSFGEALGHIALDDDETARAPPVQTADTGLVLEQEITAEARHLEVTRKTTPEGALAALKQYLLEHASFREALWYAITNPGMTVDEVGALADVASWLYDAKTSYMVRLRLPRPYRAERVRDATVRFWQFGAYRTRPSKELSPEDWQTVQSLGLKYNGPHPPVVAPARPEVIQEESLKSQIEALRQQKAALESTQAQASSSAFKMPPPIITTEKTGLKLSLGNKRKQSTSMTPREESPKAPKISKHQSAHASAASPNVMQDRRGSSHASLAAQHMKKSGARELLVVFKMTLKASTKAAAILAGPRKSADVGRTTSRPTSATPSLQQSQGASHSPSTPELFRTSSSGAAPQPVLNPGAFRSYGPPADAPPMSTKALSPGLKEEPSDTVLPTASQVDSPTIILPDGPRSLDTSVNNDTPADSQERRTPLPKLSLKLGRKPQHD